ncbi:MAG: hypothetical protein EBR81_11805, partial [Proteobacteria bacterium]|nr:hypothetical protein [Pseudomonadota bacterium]
MSAFPNVPPSPSRFSEKILSPIKARAPPDSTVLHNAAFVLDRHFSGHPSVFEAKTNKANHLMSHERLRAILESCGQLEHLQAFEAQGYDDSLLTDITEEVLANQIGIKGG